MKLERENGTVFEQPGEHDIEHALDTLGQQGNGFAILSQDVMTYIQTAGSRDTGYRLEYQAGDTDRHYRLPESVPKNVAVSVSSFMRRAMIPGKKNTHGNGKKLTQQTVRDAWA